MRAAPWLFLLTIFVLSSCGYHMGSPLPNNLSRSSVTVPFIKGDLTGDLTQALIYELTTSGYRYVHRQGDILIRVQLLEVRADDIGFRYERESDNDVKKSLIPAETRLTAKAQVEVIDASTCCQLLPTFCVSEFVEFDHEYYTARDGVNIFSLGQLSDYDAGKEAAQMPLNRKLAQKIVLYLDNMW
jgi:hypothetical protein